ncbi:Glycosyltransferase involved in cell wall bisynthesis [Neorhodopirellula lusitana]|uniref:Glycosyltransferase involved in cell wall bisynthesis n=1 Tax=Neorhodopirellula lusitana TaxID=445327 RepID=A0ABY1Q6H3_9BACT|nr:glycosyltransferase [Neorhodopirellula lusitana]SMP57205.1 Glycosyltransferase involved in cell wall bisynthesis [Neorhodopirellula lusitana]
MDVDFVITEFEVGGAERTLARLAIGLQQKGNSVRVYSIGRLPTAEDGDGRDQLVRALRDNDVMLESADATSVREFPMAAWRLRRWIQQRPAAVCQTFLFHANTLTNVFAKPLQASGPRVAGIRVADPSRWRCAMERRALRQVDHVICVSNAVERFTHQHLGLSADQTSVIGNSVDVDHFATAPPMDWRTFGWDADADVVLFVGRLHPQKNLGLLQSTLDQFAPLGSNRKLVMVGMGPLRAELASWSEAVSGDRVRVLPWRADVASLLAGCRVLVLPSHYEGMPNVVLEAMAAGKPVVCSLVEGSEELIGNDPHQGFAAGDSAVMTAKLNQFLDDRSLSDRVGRSNQLRMREEFSVQGMVDQYRELYAKLGGE